LNYRGKGFPIAVNARQPIRQKFSLLIFKGNFHNSQSGRFRPLSPTIGRFVEISGETDLIELTEKDRQRLSFAYVTYGDMQRQGNRISESSDEFGEESIAPFLNAQKASASTPKDGIFKKRVEDLAIPPLHA
jgi:hypothetical protein